MFKSRSDYTLALLQLLDGLPDHQGKAREIRALFIAHYTDSIPPTGFELLANGRLRCDNEIMWCRYDCVQNGLMDSPSTGIWRITEKGRQYLQENQSTLSHNWDLPGEAAQERKILELRSGNSQMTKEKPEEVSVLQAFGDFFVPLMRVLDDLPDRAGKTGDVLLIFEETYHKQIGPELYTKNQSGNIRWEHNVRWSREKLKLLGLLDSPQYGVWQLTEKGHLWLKDHPAATHLTAEKSKSGRKAKTTSFTPPQKGMESVSNFFAFLQDGLQSSLNEILGSIHYEFAARSNYLQIRMADFSGCHFEIVLRRQKHEIALHFESSAERSQARLRSFESHIESLSQSLQTPIYAGSFQKRGWTQIYLEAHPKPLTDELAQEYTNLVKRFVAATFPILKNAYAEEKRPHTSTVNTEKFVSAHPMHAILDQEVSNIRMFLEGRSSLSVSDEKLCDWVHLCYLLGLFKEAKELFTLVNMAEVNTWYYEKTKKVARICEMRNNFL